MSKVKVTIKHIETATFSIGDLPVAMIRQGFEKNDGTFDGNWSLGDLGPKDNWEIESIEVEEVK